MAYIGAMDGTRTDTIETRLARVRERIDEAARRAGRDGASVRIVAVTKTFGPGAVEAIVRAGLDDIGENRVQEMLAKADRVRTPCRWHLLGPLQRNKVRKVVGRIAMLHALDDLRVADALDRVAAERDVVVDVLVQVNTSGEATKHGFAPERAVEAVVEAARRERLRVRGLMTIGPLGGSPEAVRRAFGDLARLRAQAQERLGRALPELSMGMSDDFEIAVEEGATIVRLGRVLTGPRSGAPWRPGEDDGSRSGWSTGGGAGADDHSGPDGGASGRAAKRN